MSVHSFCQNICNDEWPRMSRKERNAKCGAQDWTCLRLNERSRPNTPKTLTSQTHLLVVYFATTGGHVFCDTQLQKTSRKQLTQSRRVCFCSTCKELATTFVDTCDNYVPTICSWTCIIRTEMTLLTTTCQNWVIATKDSRGLAPLHTKLTKIESGCFTIVLLPNLLNARKLPQSAC